MKMFLLGTLFACLIAILIIMAYTLTRKDRLRSLYLAVLCFAVGTYVLGYILEIVSPTVEAAEIANRLQNFGIPMIAPVYLLFILNTCQYRFAKYWMMLPTLFYSVTVFTVILFNNHHMLYYTSFERLPVWDFHYVLLGRGPLYYAHQALINVCGLFTYVALFHRMRTWDRRHRRQMSFIVAGSLVTFFSYVLYAFRIIPQQIDPAPIAMTFSLVCFAICVARYGLYDITGIAVESAIQSMDDAVVIVDSYWSFLTANASAIKLFPDIGGLPSGRPVQEAAGWPQELLEQTGQSRVNFELSLPDGKKQFFRAHISPVGGGSAPVGWSIVIRDITEMTELLEQMQVLAITDPLTGISNRRHFLDHAQRRLNMSQRELTVSSLIIFDIDHFKLVNDSYGHLVGDEVLKRITQTVSSELRDYDLFARYGGEEFVVLAYNISGYDALNFAQRLCDLIRETTVTCRDAEVQVTASFGLVEMDWDTELDEALREADAALYRAKQSGRDRVMAGAAQPLKREEARAGGD